MRQLAKIVEGEAFHWGDSVTEGYFTEAEKDFDEDWTSIVRPFLEGYPINYAHTVDLACGRGRNSAALSRLASHMTLVDVNHENIAACIKRFRGRAGFTFVKNNGFDLRAVHTESVTFVYSFDSMVHFDLDIVIAYLWEISRVLSTDGYGFIHHSNYTAAPTAAFTANPLFSKRGQFSRASGAARGPSARRGIGCGFEARLQLLRVLPGAVIR